MLAQDNSSDEEDDDAENASVQKQKSISGDDLGDSFTLDDEHRHKKGWVDKILERKDASDTESEDDSAEDSDSSQEDEDGDSDGESEEDDSTRGMKQCLKDWEQSDDDILDTDSEEDGEASKGEKEKEGPKETNKSAISKSSKSDGSSEDAKKLVKDTKRQNKPELPYIIEAPVSFDEFLSLLADCSNSDIILIIGRIRASNAIQLTEKNLEKMQVYSCLYFNVIT